MTESRLAVVEAQAELPECRPQLPTGSEQTNEMRYMEGLVSKSGDFGDINLPAPIHRIYPGDPDVSPYPHW